MKYEINPYLLYDYTSEHISFYESKTDGFVIGSGDDIDRYCKKKKIDVPSVYYNIVFAVDAKNTQALLNILDACGVEKACSEVVGRKVFVLNISSNKVDLPEKYQKFENLYYQSRIYHVKVTSKDTYDRLLGTRDDISDIKTFEEKEKVKRSFAGFKILLIVFAVIQLLFALVINSRFGLFFLLIWVAELIINHFRKKKDSSYDGYRSSLFIFIAMALCFVLSFRDFEMTNISVLTFPVMFFCLYKMRKRDYEKAISGDSAPKVSSDVVALLNNAFDDPQKYLDYIYKDKGITIAPRFKYQKLFEFYQNALYFRNPSRSVMALLDYIEMILRLSLYRDIIKKDEDSFDPKAVSYNLLRMAVRIYDVEKDGDRKDIISKRYTVKDLEKSFLVMLKEQLRCDFEGDEIDFCGLVSVVGIMRNRVVAHGVIRDENLGMIWTFLVYASVLLTSYLGVENIDVKR
ncbi:MAG: hypothetical protein K6G10_10345, partial [Butyrivibrio sp.]|nr:hypothetical protein [Butyrivibrio sp.]